MGFIRKILKHLQDSFRKELKHLESFTLWKEQTVKLWTVAYIKWAYGLTAHQRGMICLWKICSMTRKKIKKCVFIIGTLSLQLAWSFQLYVGVHSPQPTNGGAVALGYKGLKLLISLVLMANARVNLNIGNPAGRTYCNADLYLTFFYTGNE